MAKQRKTLPARRKNAIDTSLLIRSAESLGRVIGSLQRQLDAARQLTTRSGGNEPRGNGHAPERKRVSSGNLKQNSAAKTRRRTTTKASRSK
jgi:hypothetical protein